MCRVRERERDLGTDGENLAKRKWILMKTKGRKKDLRSELR